MKTRTLSMLAVLGLIAASCTTTSSVEVVAVSLTDFAIAPASSTADAATSIQFEVANDGQAPHTLAIEVEGETIVTPELAGGESAVLDVPALSAGTYTLWCSIPGHRELGMEATFAVGSDASAEGVAGLSPQEIDDAHREVVEAFPAETEAMGGQPLEPRLVDGVKVFTLVPEAVRWEVSPGEFVDAYGYNGQVPGPEIRVRQGDRIRVEVRNELPESTTVHFHGLTVPNAMDGVPFINQDLIEPGGEFTYEFKITDGPGTHMYHSHHNALAQVGKGLVGALIIEPRPRDVTWDREYTLMLGDGHLGYTINGKGFPATVPVVASAGDRVRIRFLNEGLQVHPMHLHGVHFTVVARDGVDLESPYMLDTVLIAPGERYDVEFVVGKRHIGTWAFHCHVLSHVDSEHGLHGMVTVLVVQ